MAVILFPVYPSKIYSILSGKQTWKLKYSLKFFIIIKVQILFSSQSQTIPIFIMKRYFDMTGTWKPQASDSLISSQFAGSQSTHRHAHMAVKTQSKGLSFTPAKIRSNSATKTKIVREHPKNCTGKHTWVLTADIYSTLGQTLPWVWSHIEGSLVHEWLEKK